MHTAGRENHTAIVVRRSRSFVFVLLIATVGTITMGRAWAHAVIVESTPAVNGVVTGPALEIKLRFNSRIDGNRSKVRLMAPDSTSRAVTLSQQTSPDVLTAKIQNLTPGKYQLHWQVLASDGHITQGDIPFSVVNP